MKCNVLRNAKDSLPLGFVKLTLLLLLNTYFPSPFLRLLFKEIEMRGERKNKGSQKEILRSCLATVLLFDK